MTLFLVMTKITVEKKPANLGKNLDILRKNVKHVRTLLYLEIFCLRVSEPICQDVSWNLHEPSRTMFIWNPHWRLTRKPSYWAQGSGFEWGVHGRAAQGEVCAGQACEWLLRWPPRPHL